MHEPRQKTLLKAALGALVTTLVAGGAWSQQAPADAGGPALQAKYAALASQLARNPFQRPLVIDSSESAKAVSGNAYAVINYPFSAVNAAFKDPETWCEVLMLHLNTKHCRATDSPAVLEVSVGRKNPQEVKDAYTLAFAFELASAAPDYMAVQLNAGKGPLGTHDYRINLKAVPVAGGKTFMHLQYAYGYGMAGRIAMQGYLATLGSGKVGFTALEQPAGTDKPLVTGLRGAIERNTMRYYLAIDAYLASLDAPAGEQLEKRLRHWFDATERYPRQLREMDRATYLAMKRSEYQRQQVAR